MRVPPDRHSARILLGKLQPTAMGSDRRTDRQPDIVIGVCADVRGFVHLYIHSDIVNANSAEGRGSSRREPARLLTFAKKQEPVKTPACLAV